jgi:amylosucrase
MGKRSIINWNERQFCHENELRGLYKSIYSNNEAYEQLKLSLKSYYESRPEKLKKRDMEDEQWTQNRNTVGMMLYVDCFAGNLKKLAKKASYFKSLGITLIHLMPILKPREGQNDGGYAVQNYREIDPKIGNMDDFKKVIDVFHKSGIRVCIDFVMNHTAKEHEWAQKAIQGIKPYDEFYLMYDSDEIPRAYEQTVPQVFPKVSPGNFTYYESYNKWVFTSFYEFQWDLNYANPLVFNAMVENMLYFTNIGIDLIRLDAIPFIWKELGTNCRNLPNVHKILRMFQIIAKMIAPSSAILGEAIVEPDEIVKYFGQDDKMECNLLYNASYMVDIWNAIATRDGRYLSASINRYIPKEACWINYARCHDDIGWGVDDNIIRELGFDPFSHKQFLINFYNGTIPDSFARGRLYEFNPENMDARNSGTLASLSGLEKAVYENDAFQKDMSIKRIKLIHAIVLLSRGVPMIYSGDEIGELNDYSYENNDEKAHDSRWLHRGIFDWENIISEDPIKSKVYEDTKHLIELRKQLPIFDGKFDQINIKSLNNKHVFGFVRRAQDDEIKPVVALFNFSEHDQVVSTYDIKQNKINGSKTDIITGKTINLDEETILLGPLDFLILQ